MPEALYYSEIDHVLYVKAVGHITAALCGDLRETIYKRLQSQPTPLGLVIDLGECDYMDSTFMGLLVGMNKKCLASYGQRLTLFRPSIECTKLLTSLGVIKLLVISQSVNFPAVEQLGKIAKKNNPTTEILLSAHENLMELSQENQQKFSTLQGLLKKQMEDEKRGK